MTLGIGEKTKGFSLLEFILALGLASSLAVLSWASLSNSLHKSKKEFLLRKLEYRLSSLQREAVRTGRIQIFSMPARNGDTVNFYPDGTVQQTSLAFQTPGGEYAYVDIAEDGTKEFYPGP